MLLNKRFTSLCYGSAAGIAFTQLFGHDVVLLSVFMATGFVSEVYRGYMSDGGDPDA